ncbi:hypothetical protein EHQ23_02435 [Leptospira bourretii]|uniref:HNH endonuclease n=1 Tax=Leptospira bourretii TaxID=2484962 RepID=A0A4R9IMK2_9LEPT|nr:hypothetical protein [Leptospira bourretii]TGK89994.1 hypothetical protein EHQ23_02435 [Leptospira bourretii]TGK92217.1 hypothetical protein EHQ26_09580 [Leptospira bourretii]TGL27496.1 hypothetical protein EHQ45_17530 [Leptospira bourretii]
MRLTPKSNTLRELYLKSGNQCAFPECNELMINSEGEFIGNVCHIEAAEPEGQRYNSLQTDEDRRSYSNLMLMCQKHHKITNNVEKYTTETLKTIKKNHEKKFEDIAMIIGKSIRDWTENQFVITPKNIRKIETLLKWNFEQYQFQPTIDDIIEYSKRLEELPLNTRKLFLIMAKNIKLSHDYSPDSVDPRIIEEKCSINHEELERHLVLLEKARLCSRVNIRDYEDPTIEFYNTKTDWRLLRELNSFCNLSGNTLDEFLLDLDFSILDDN